MFCEPSRTGSKFECVRYTLMTDIGRELVGELSRDLQDECYPVNLISSKVVVI
jgi:hypothetical protein